MKNLLLIIITTLCIHTLPAQDTAQWQWAVRMGGFFGDPQANAVDDVPTDMAVDSTGNVFVTGRVSTPVIANDSSIGNNRKVDEYLVSYDCEGNFRWMHLYGSVGRDGSNVFDPSVTIDNNQNVFLGSFLTGNESTTASIGDTSFSGNYFPGMILSKFTNSGSFQWVKKGDPFIDPANLKFHKSHMVKISYHDGNTVSLFQSDSTEIFPGTVLDGGTYIGWFDPAQGALQDYVKLSTVSPKMNAQEIFYIDGMAVDSEGNVVVGFNIGDTVEIGGEMFYPDPTMISVAKFNPQGDMLWHFDVQPSHATLPKPSVLYGLTVGKEGSVYFGGRTIEGEIFDSDTVKEVIVTSDLSLEFMVKLSSEGDYQWLRYPDKTNFNGFTGLATDNKNRITATGYMARFSEYGNTRIEQEKEEFEASHVDPHYVTYSADGDFMDGQVLNGLGGQYDRGLTLAYDAVNNLYIGGAFNDDMIIGTDTLDNEGGLSDVFIAKYGTAQCVDTSDTDTSDPTGLQRISSTAPDLRLMPNPAATSTTVTLVAPQDQLTQQPTLTVYDLSGRAVRSHLHPRMAVDAGNGNMAVAWRLDVSGLESGVYVVTSSNGKWEVSEKLMVE